MPYKKLGTPVTLTPCPYSPDRFNARLEEVFGDRLRLRWSLRYACWLVEQKVGHGATFPFRVEEWDDLRIAAKDGYAPVMRVQPGDRMACPHCGLAIPVPICESAETACTICTTKNIDCKVMTAYFPLGEVLIDHLKKIDPARREQRERVHAEEQKALAAKHRDEEAGHRESREQLKDAFLDQLPKAGFPSLTPDGWYH